MPTVDIPASVIEDTIPTSESTVVYSPKRTTPRWRVSSAADSIDITTIAT